jgi:rhamnosyltransferase subunit B
MVDPCGLPQLNALRAQHSLPPVPHLLPHLTTPADFTVNLFPTWFAPTQPDWHGPVVSGSFPLHDPHDAAPGAPPAGVLSPELQAFLDAGDAPLVLTPGSANVHAHRLFNLATQVVQQLGRRAVFLTPHRAQVPAELPPQVLWQPYVPLAALLPRAALLLHHGGVGTLAQALRAGVPQLVVPHGWDQFDNAVRLRQLGVARSCPVYRLYRRPLRRHLQALLSDPAVRSACTAAAQRCRSDTAWRELPERILAQAAALPLP